MNKLFFKYVNLLLCLLLLTNSFLTTNTIYADDPIPDLEIRNFSVSLVDGAELKNGKYVWNAQSYAEGHGFVFQINFALSGQYDVEENKVQIRIPRRILKDRNGNYADEIEMSIPSKQAYESGTPVSEDVNYYFYFDGDDVVIENFRKYYTGENAFIQVKYKTTKTTFEYRDIYTGSNKPDDYIDASDPFKASINASIINALKEEVNVSENSNEIPVYINTTAQIVMTTKRTPDMYKEWDPKWGDPIENADNYYYLVWPIHTSINPGLTQPYRFEIEENYRADKLLGSVVGYKLEGEYIFSDKRVDEYSTVANSRMDYVLTKHDKALWHTEREKVLYIENAVLCYVLPYDRQDARTNSYSTASYNWRYENPSFIYPPGSFASYKRADRSYEENEHHFDYLEMLAGDYSSYELHKLIDGRITYIDNLDYAVWAEGLPYPWTIGNNSDSDPNSYGTHKVRYEIVDETFILYEEASGFPNPNVGLDSNTYGIPVITEDTFVLDYNDFQIDTLAYAVEIEDAYFKEITGSFVKKGYGEFLDDDVIHIYGRFNDDPTYIEVASKNLLTGEMTYDENYVKQMSNIKVYFKDGVNCVGYKVTFDTNHYYTKVKCVPNIRLKNSQRVLDYIKDMESIAILNSETSSFYDYQGNKLGNRSESEVDYICKSLERSRSFIEKIIVSTVDSVFDRQYRIGWRINMYERFILNEEREINIKQNGGTFYDLLPGGATLDLNSITVYDGGSWINKSYYNVSTIDNYNGTGRTLLIVDIDYVANEFSLMFETIHSWDVISDWGKFVYNPVIYKTGNNEISDINPRYRGFNKEKNLFQDIIDEYGEKRFIYAENNYNISIISSAAANLSKKVKDSTDSDYSYDTWTRINGDYSYRLRFQNTISTKSKDIILFDSLENYIEKQPDNSYLNSEWHGTLQSIDLTQLRKIGINPIVYLSSKEKLNIEDNHDISDSNVWTRIEDFGDISKAKAIAIDCRKNSKGEDFILPKSSSIEAVLYMKAPSGLTYEGNHYPRTFNNVYIEDTIIDSNGRETHFFIHQDYTIVSYKVAADLKIHKVNGDNHNEPINGIFYVLKGTSFYGNYYESLKTTNERGNLTFEDIEKGEYDLIEVYCSDDWQLDKTTHKVVVNNDGIITIDGNPIDDLGVYTVENFERIHGDLNLTKIKEGTTVKQKQIIEEILNTEPKSNKTVKIDGKEFYVLVIDEFNSRALLAQSEPFYYLFSSQNHNREIADNYNIEFWYRSSNVFMDNYTVNNYSNQFLSDKPTLDGLAIKSEFPVYGSHWEKYANRSRERFVEDDVKIAITKAIPLSYSDFNLEHISDKVDYTYNNDFIIDKSDTHLWDLFKLTALRTSEYDWPFYGIYGGFTNKHLNAYFDGNSTKVLFADQDMSVGVSVTAMEYYPERYPTGMFYNEKDPVLDNVYNFYAKTVPVVWVDLSGLKADTPVPNTTFRLEGISDYGNDMTSIATSDKDGNLSFKNIEKGIYKVKEIIQNEDYVINKTVWNFIVNEDGSTVLQEPTYSFRDRLSYVDYLGTNWIVQNEPRYWKFEIDKVLKGDHDTHISGVTFNLSGISDLKNEFNVNSVTDENGIARFERIEKGNYILREIATADDGNNYYLNEDVYSVSIDYTGRVRIPLLEEKEKNVYYFENEIIEDGEIFVTKKWADYATNNRKTPRIHLSTIPLDSLSSIYDFDDDGKKDLGNGEYEYISFNDRWLSNGLNTMYYKFKVLNDSIKYYVYEEPISGYHSEAISNYVVVNEDEITKTVTVENISNSGNKIYITKKVEAGNLYSAPSVEGSTVLHSDNIDDNGTMITPFDSRVGTIKHARIEGAEYLDIVLTADIGNALYVYSGDPADPNSKAYKRQTYDADFAINRPYGNYEDNTYHFRIEGEHVTIVYSSTYSSNRFDRYGFFASIKAAGSPIGEASIPESENNKEYLIKLSFEPDNKPLYIDDVFFFNGEGYFKLKDGEIKVFNDLTISNYHIVEIGEEDNYETYYQNGGYGSREHTILNKYIDEEKTRLVLRKKVTGNYFVDEDYEFTIDLSNLKGNTKYNVSNGDVIESGPLGDAVYTVVLKANDEISIEDIPYGTKYKIKEGKGTYISSYQIIDENNVEIVKDNDKNYFEDQELSTSIETLSKDEANTVIFTNEINKYQDLYVSKQVIGNNYDYEFEFDLLINNLIPKTYYETSLGRFISDESGVIQRTIVIRHGEVFEAYNLPINATYSIEEKDYVRDGFVSSVTTNTENSTITGRKVSGTIIYGENPEISYVNVEHAVVSGGKSWLDGGLSHNNPDEIELILYRYSDNFDEEIVDAEPIWEDDTFYYLDLQLNDEFDSPYTYRVVEKEIEGYTSVVDNFNLINTRDKASIILRKEVTGDGADENKEFTFTIKLTNKENKPVSGNFSGVAFDENGIGVVKLKHNQEIEIEIYKDIKYEISEDPEDYICEIDKADGIVGQGNNTHLFVNGKYNTEEPSKKVNDETRIVFKDFEDDIVYTISQVVPEYCESFIIEDNIPSELIIVSYSINDENLTVTKDGQLIKVECNDKEILSKLKNKEIVLTIVTKVDESKLVYDTSIENTATTTINNQVFTTNSTYVDVPPPDDNPPDEKIYVPPKTGLE